MNHIVPQTIKNTVLQKALKAAVYAFSAMLFVSIFIGLLLLLDDEEPVRQAGRYMIFVPLGISAVQIVVGLIIKAITKHKG